MPEQKTPRKPHTKHTPTKAVWNLDMIWKGYAQAARGLTQPEQAMALGVSFNTYKEWMKNRPPFANATRAGHPRADGNREPGGRPVPVYRPPAAAVLCDPPPLHRLNTPTQPRRPALQHGPGPVTPSTVPRPAPTFRRFLAALSGRDMTASELKRMQEENARRITQLRRSL